MILTWRMQSVVVDVSKALLMGNTGTPLVPGGARLCTSQYSVR